MRAVIKRVWGKVAACFLAGVFAILPLVVTVAIALWVAGFIEGMIGPGTFLGSQLRFLGMHVVSDSALAYVAGWVIVLAAIFGLGIAVQFGSVRLLNKRIDPILRRIPLAGNVYSTAAQVVGMLDRSEAADLKGMSVVYCAFGKENGTGLLALMPSPDRYRLADRDYHVVYVPTSPLPMTGGLLFVPVESVRSLDMKVDELMSIYLSMGVTGPQFLCKH
jgi:uncharacterized membrane protein